MLRALNDVIASPNQPAHKAADLTLLKEYIKGVLISVIDKSYEMVLKVEHMFWKYQCDLVGKDNIKKTLMEDAVNLTKDFDITTCQNLKNKILSRLIDAPLHFYCRKMNEKKTTEKKELYRT